MPGRERIAWVRRVRAIATDLRTAAFQDADVILSLRELEEVVMRDLAAGASPLSAQEAALLVMGPGEVRGEKSRYRALRAAWPNVDRYLDERLT
jgi:hypothetical protein